jgi:maltooligosyltrehalose trehalohydrolase
MHAAEPVRQIDAGQDSWRSQFGAWRESSAWNFRVWTPAARKVELITGGGASRSLLSAPGGMFVGRWSDLRAGDQYWYRIDGHGPFPDPASRWQPCGVHGPSQLVDPASYEWHDEPRPTLSLADTIIYQLHIGTFTPAGTFKEGARALPRLVDLGVTAIELMPIAAFAGTRNWGYDGVALFAPAACYGTPDDFRGFVATAHGLGLPVLLDVVYDHLGPDGAYHTQYAKDYVSAADCPWGHALNLRQPDGDMVRALCLDNALHWIHEYHVDGLRLDATHAYRDEGAAPSSVS